MSLTAQGDPRACGEAAAVPNIGTLEIQQMINESSVANTVTRGPKLKATEPNVFSDSAIENPEDWYNRLMDYFRLSHMEDKSVQVTTFESLCYGMRIWIWMIVVASSS